MSVFEQRDDEDGNQERRSIHILQFVLPPSLSGCDAFSRRIKQQFQWNPAAAFAFLLLCLLSRPPPGLPCTIIRAEIPGSALAQLCCNMAVGIGCGRC